MSKIGLGILFMVASNLHINLLLGMPAGQIVSSFRSGIFFFVVALILHIYLFIKLCSPLEGVYCSDCLQQKRPPDLL